MAERRWYPTFLDLEGKSCLVVGGGPVALEKARGLLECGARVTVVAPRIEGDLLDLPVGIVEGGYRSSDLDGRFLVIAATDDEELNRRVSADAAERDLLCNVADRGELCSFILPAVHRQGPITVAVSTGGASPALAQRIRDRVAELVGPEHADLARRLRDLRPAARERFATYEERRDYFRELVEEALP
jgi:siroheme synthase-like protein